MSALRTAAQQALEALEWHYRQGHSNTLGGLRLKIDEKALRNLKAALAKPTTEDSSEVEPVQEPVAWRWGYRSVTTGEMDWRGYVEIAAHPNLRSPEIIMEPLYTAPPQRRAEPAQEPPCNPHPKAPHRFLRNASHTEDRYVCECEGWEPYEAGYQAGMEAALRAQS